MLNKIKARKLIIEPEVIIEKDSFANAWFRGLRHIKMNGREIQFGGVDQNKKFEKKIALDSDLTISLTENALEEAMNGKIHPQFPTKALVLQGYLKEWERGYDWRKQGFTYCYEDRAEAYKGYRTLTGKYLDPFTIDQWKLAKEDIAGQIATGIQSNRNVIVIGNPSVDRYEIPDSPPCLREIWIRWEGFIDNIPVCSAKWVFRSRDFGTAWMTNVVGLLSAINREVLKPNKCELIQAVDKSHSTHVYRGDWDLMETVKRIAQLDKYL
jgi:thymidylate synthase